MDPERASRFALAAQSRRRSANPDEHVNLQEYMARMMQVEKEFWDLYESWTPVQREEEDDQTQAVNAFDDIVAWVQRTFQDTNADGEMEEEGGDFTQVLKESSQLLAKRKEQHEHGTPHQDLPYSL